eukprot:Awhi_evm1s13680
MKLSTLFSAFTVGLTSAQTLEYIDGSGYESQYVCQVLCYYERSMCEGYIDSSDRCYFYRNNEIYKTIDNGDLCEGYCKSRPECQQKVEQGGYCYLYKYGAQPPTPPAPPTQKPTKPTPPQGSAPIDISKTIVVERNQVFDGKGQTYRGKGLGNGNQDEDQKPLFFLKEGATLKNLIITAPAADGVHIEGKNILVENVIWEDVGEDALSSKSNKDVSVTIRNCEAYKAEDKVFQFNQRATLVLENFKGKQFGRLIRSHYYMDLTLKNIDIERGSSMVYIENDKDRSAGHSPVSMTNIKAKSVRNKIRGGPVNWTDHDSGKTGSFERNRGSLRF